MKSGKFWTHQALHIGMLGGKIGGRKAADAPAVEYNVLFPEPQFFGGILEHCFSSV